WGLGFNNLIELRDVDTKTAAHTWQARVQMRHLAPRLLPDNGCEIGGEAGGAPAVGIRGGELRNDGVEGICFTQETGNAVVIQRLKRGSSVDQARTYSGRHEETLQSALRVQSQKIGTIHARQLHAGELHSRSTLGRRGQFIPQSG